MNYIWYKNAIFYSLDVETFYDSNGDGIGDFEGLIQRLDYLAGLGINCIWLLPFYPSPNRDNGYDVMDYYDVDSRLGSLGDFAEFMDKAGQLGIRVIIDLVVNHTSIEHPWFQEARRSPESKYHQYYVWSDEPLEFDKEHLMLAGEEQSVWTYDEEAKKYYLHHFYKEQPDLNIANPGVRQEILKIMGFWLRLGVSGFRIDAAELLIETYGTNGGEEGHFAEFLTEMREFITAKESNAILIAETNISPDKVHTYINSGRRMHMLFNFYLNQHLFVSLARQDPSPLSKAIASFPKIENENQWLNFLRHHDELSLKLLNEQEREEIYSAFAPDKEMRIFETGVRRRLAPMLKQNRPHMELAFSLLFSLPGTPLIRYGDELGMGENLELPGRKSVRTPMQWTEAAEGGFSVSAENQICPVLSEGSFAFHKINVRKLQHDPSSFLSWIERLIIARKQFEEIGRGDIEVLESANGLFIHSYKWGNKKAFFFHNLSDKQISYRLSTLKLEAPELYEIFGDNADSEIAEDVVLAPFGYKWFKEIKIKNI